MLPALSKNVDFDVWQMQYEAATKAKIFTRFSGDAAKDNPMLEDYRLSTLPSVLGEEILVGVTAIFRVKTTTFNSAIAAIREQWIRITRPTDLSAELLSIRINSTEDVIPAWRSLQRLCYYTKISDALIVQHLTNAISDASTKQLFQAFSYGKTLSPREVVDFLSSLTFSDNKISSVSAVTRVVCYNCNRNGHISTNCDRPKTKCSFCQRKGHLKLFCPSVPKN
jgi:hypothetical protein